MRAIAARLGRDPGTISRELARNSDAKGEYRAMSAHAQAYERASRPKPAKLAINVVLRERVEHYLEKRYSPEQIAGRLRVEFPDQPEMWVSTETIYQSLYVQSRGRCAGSSPAACAPGGRCAGPAGHRDSARTASPTWLTSPNAQLRPLTARCPVTGRAT